MMSEKRFEVDIDHLLLVWDTEKNKRLEIEDIVGLLNEQQDIIFKLQDLCGKSDGENMKLRIENKRLEKEVNLLKPTNIEQYEQIQKLQGENEQLKQEIIVYKKAFQEQVRRCTL